MDLQDFEAQGLYFDQPILPEVEKLLALASEHYADGEAEPFLNQAFALAPDDLTVLVGLYRFYYYQHRYEEAKATAFHAMGVVGKLLGFRQHWQDLGLRDLENGVMISFTLVRFYLMALKGAAYLNLRQGNMQEGIRMLNKVVEMDSNDRIGASALLQSIGPVGLEQPREAALSSGH